MAVGNQKGEDIPSKHFGRQLAAAVQSIQWSYAIFWSVSTRQPGVLEWNDGYYNGNIKTRKTTQSMELKSDQMGLQRSEQLRQLYVSLSAGDSDQLARRPSALLSPEDLSDSEWYYLVCMSFTFRQGHGYPSLIYYLLISLFKFLLLFISRCLFDMSPTHSVCLRVTIFYLLFLVGTVTTYSLRLVGRTSASGSHIWVTDAHSADSKTFTRSLLAKSASIQTLLCCPFLGGVLELGTTETVLEDPDLIQQVKTSFWDFPEVVSSERSLSSNIKVQEDEGQRAPSQGHDMLNCVPSENVLPVADCRTQSRDGAAEFERTLHTHSSIYVAELNEDQTDKLPAESSEELKTGSPDCSSNDCCSNHHSDESEMQGADGMSQAHTWLYMDDELSNGLQGSLNSSDIKFHKFSNLQAVSLTRGQRIKYVNDFQVCCNTGLPSLDPGTNNSHYTRILSALLKIPARVDVMTFFPNASHASSFKAWRGGSDIPHPHICTKQKLLKKILCNVTLMHPRPPKSSQGNGTKGVISKPGREAIGVSHLLLERRREQMNKNFLVLKSLLPSISKVDKASILGDTIEYLKELETRVEYLESYMELGDLEAKGGRKHPDVAERTSDNYGRDETAGGKKSFISKRKACDLDEKGLENHWILSRDGLADVNVTVIGKEVLIQMSCPWRDCLLLEIVDAVSKLHLDAHSVQSSTVAGNLCVTIKSKFRGAAVASPGMIKCALRRVTSRC